MPHAGLGGRSVYERAPDPETDPRSLPPRAEFALRYSRYYSVLNSVLAYSRYYSSPHSARFVEPGSCDLLAKSDARIGRKQDAVCDQQTLPSCLACRAAFDSSPNPCAMKHDAPNQVSNRVVQLTNLDNQGKMASRWHSSASYLRLFYFNPPSTYLRLNYGPQLRVPNSQQS